MVQHRWRYLVTGNKAVITVTGISQILESAYFNIYCAFVPLSVVAIACVSSGMEEWLCQMLAVKS